MTRRGIDVWPTFSRNFLSIQKVLLAMIGISDDPWLFLVIWGFILIPLGLVWGVGKVVGWIAAGFRIKSRP
jgi:hypothetical protein